MHSMVCVLRSYQFWLRVSSEPELDDEVARQFLRLDFAPLFLPEAHHVLIWNAAFLLVMVGDWGSLSLIKTAIPDNLKRAIGFEHTTQPW